MFEAFAILVFCLWAAFVLGSCTDFAIYEKWKNWEWLRKLIKENEMAATR